MARFHNTRLIICNWGAFKRGAAMALPGLGIVVGKDYTYDYELLMHEYGHILQAQRWGYFFFYTRVAISSLISAWKKPDQHIYHWTEWTANLLSKRYFNKEDWDECYFPTQASEYKTALPPFCRDKAKFYSQYLADDRPNDILT